MRVRVLVCVPEDFVVVVVVAVASCRGPKGRVKEKSTNCQNGSRTGTREREKLRHNGTRKNVHKEEEETADLDAEQFRASRAHGI